MRPLASFPSLVRVPFCLLALWVAAVCGAYGQSALGIIRLNAGPIDTSAPAAAPRVKTLAQPTGKQLHLVQFTGPVQPAWLQELRDAGFTVVNYIPDNAYLVYADAPVIQSWQAALADRPHVKWEGAYTSTMKIQPGAAAAGTKSTLSATASDLYAIQLFRDDSLNAQTVAFINGIALAPPVRDRIVAKFRNIIVRLPSDQVAAVSARPDVVSVARYAVPEKKDERQAVILAGQLTTAGVGTNVPSAPGYTNWLAGRGFTQLQFDASGLVVDVTDSGIDNGTTNANHFALYSGGSTNGTSRVVYNRLVGTPSTNSSLAGLDGHGTINAHIIAGMVTNGTAPHVDAGGYRYSLGVAPFVKVGSSVIFDPDNFTFPDYSNLASLAYSNGARVSCNSWGSFGTPGEYTVDSQEYDFLVRDAQPPWSSSPAAGNQQMTFVFAAGNDGPGPTTVSPPATAKNVIAVGAAENVRSLSTANGGNNAAGEDGSGVTDLGADNANDMIDFSSRGPCTDDRVKPDIVAPGTHITGGVAQNVKTNAAPGRAITGFDASGISALPGGGTTNNTNNFFPLNAPPRQQLYSVSSGTSQAAPGVTGGAALVHQWFLNTNLPAPSPAMIKAFLMNSARYMSGTGAADNLYSDNQGMGMMNLGTAFDGTGRLLRDQRSDDLFTESGQSRIFIGTVSTNTAPLRITLAWTDAYGSTTGDAYVNNLDLVVEVNGDTYIGNNFNGANSFADPDAPADFRNNVESVFIPAGTYPPGSAVTITVNAVNIAGDGVPNNSYELDQDFALVGYNLLQSAPAQVTGLAGTALSDTSIGLTWSNLNNADAYKVLRITNGVTNDLGLTADTNFTDTGLRELTTYTYRVAGTNIGGLGALSAPTNVTTMSWVAANPYGVRVTNPTSRSTNNLSTQIYSGQIGAGLLGGTVFWTNIDTGLSGFLTNTTSTNWSQSIGIVPGTNRVVFNAVYSVVTGTNTLAYDSADAFAYGSYGNNNGNPWTWSSGSTGTTNFGVWSNTVSGSSSLTVVRGGGVDVGNLSVGGNRWRGFALIGDGGVARASRTFNAPLAVGQSFVMTFDNNNLASGRSVGFALADAGGNALFNFSAEGGSPAGRYVINDAAGVRSNTGIAYTTNGLLPVSYTLLADNTYRFVAGTNPPVTGTNAGVTPISMLVLSNNLGGAGYESAFYVGEMGIESYTTASQTNSTNSPLVIRSGTTAGIPDSWWFANFGADTNAWQTSLDPDGDGQPNGAEYAAGTSPTDASSKLAITSFQRSGSNVVVTWSAVPNVTYRVESKGTLTATNWQPVPPDLTAPPGATNMGTNVTFPGPEGFLRVRVP